MSFRRTGPLPPAIGPYVVTEKLGSGGTATVYRAYHPDGHEVAVKVLSLHLADNPNVRKRFEREAHALQLLKHPHILRVEDFGEDGGRFYLAMQLLGNRSLDDLIAAGPLPVTEVARFTRQVASALDFAHSKGIIHRDIKPENILLDDQNQPYLADFGVASFVATAKGERLTTVGEFVGTPAYASPEQCKGETDKIGRTSDIYSLAVMVFEMATGRRPFEGPSPLMVIKKHLFEPPPNPLEFNPRLPKDLYGVLLKGMAKLPEGRYPSAMKFSEAVNAALGVHELSQEGEDDDWLHGDTTPISPDWPAPEPEPESPPAAAEPVPALEADTPFRPDEEFSDGPDDPFAGVPEATRFEQVVNGFAAEEFDDHFEPEIDFAEETAEPPEEFPSFESVMDFAGPAAPPPESQPDVPPEPPPDAASDAAPVIRPIGPLPPSVRPRRFIPWMQIGIYGTIIVSVVAIMVGAIIAYTELYQPSIRLDATYHSSAVGVTFKYPGAWVTTNTDLAILSEQAVSTVLLSDRPVPPRGPYGAARLVIAVQRIDPVNVFHVSSSCRGLIPDGPQRTFECMKQQKYVTPVYSKFSTGRYRGIKLPGTLPPQRASLPVILLSTSSPRWIALSIVYWNGYDDAQDVWERMAKSLRLN